MRQAKPTRHFAEPERASTGSVGLDDILGGGFDPDRVYLIEGRPGTGKTTLALQFLLQGVRRGERCLYITLSESKRELRAVAARHGWTTEGIDIFELVPPEASLDPDQELTLFHPAEMELSETTKHILDRVLEVIPSRVVFDSLSEMRLLAQSSLRYRRQILALKNFFANRQCTVVLLDDLSSHEGDLQLQSIAHGVISLEQLSLEYGAERRRLRVVKMRGMTFPPGCSVIQRLERSTTPSNDGRGHPPGEREICQPYLRLLHRRPLHLGHAESRPDGAGHHLSVRILIV